MQSYVSFPAVSSTVFAVTREVYDEYLEALPKNVKTQMDLRRVSPPKSWGRDRIVPRLYNEAKEILYEIDDKIDEMSDRLSKVGVDEVKSGLDKISKMKSLHKMTMSMKDLLGWVNDDHLLSTILFHMELAENVVFSINTDKIKKDMENTKKTEARIKKIAELAKQNKELLKAMIILALEPLLIWSALYARINGDYHYILQYEKEVAFTARAITNVEPQITLKMMREAM